MKNFIFIGVLCELLVIVLSQHSNPLKDPNICGLPSCLQTDPKFKYAEGTYYSYKYDIEASSIFNGASKNESRLFISADIKLNFLSACDGLLTVSDVILSESHSEHYHVSANSQLLSDMISSSNLRFAFEDGTIYELCPDESESQWALNFKRGVLSMIQNSMKRFDLDYSGEEEDVRGLCHTDYKLIGAKETSLLIEKTKHLESCTDRIKVNSIVQFTPVSRIESQIKNEDILKSSSRCVLSIDENIYNEIVCEENFLLEPFSNNAPGASTKVIQKLTLKERGKQRISEENEISRRTNLKFDHLIPKQPTNGDLKRAREITKRLCHESRLEENNFSTLYGLFVQELRSLSYPVLVTLYDHSGATCATAKDHILKALPYVNTAGSLGLMKDLIASKAVPESTVIDWMTTVAFITNPDKTIMESVYLILKIKRNSPAVVLSIASLAHTYCSLHSDCEKTTAIYSIVSFLQNSLENLLKGDVNDREVNDKIIVTLKALSNIGLVLEKFEEELFKVVADSNLDVGIRVAAIETFRRLPCEKHRSYFESIFMDQEDDSEVRISAYLQIMKCPSYMLVRSIAHHLRNEEVNQVGSFVWSHLHNIIKSANPLKVEIQSLLSEDDLVDKFSSDVRKFSHNREGSLHFDEYNLGGNYEANVLFQSSSYIPRSVMLNLTVNLFGKYVNLMEAQARMEGFESYIENLFGPGSKANVLKDKFEDLKSRWTREADNNGIVEGKVQDIANDVKKPKQQPEIALGMKIFGNDLKYGTFKGNREISQAMDYFNVLAHLKHILSGKEIKYKKATMFLDGSYVVPSGAGLPLFLSAVGTASVNIKLFGSLKSTGFDKKKEFSLKADFQPTVSVDVSAQMSLSAFYESTGIKLKTDMQSAISVEGDVKLKGAKLISVKFSLPKKNVKIFEARSELLVKQNNIEKPQTGMDIRTYSDSICSWPAIAETIGLQLCMDYSFKNVSDELDISSFALAGPTNFQIYVHKSDPTANVYLFEYKWTQGRDSSVVSLTFDTPGSTVRRLMHANFTSNRNSHNLTMLMQSATGVILARGNIKNTDDQKIFQMTLDINDMKHLDTVISYDRIRSVNGYIYKPRVYLGVNGERIMELQGSVDLIKKRDIAQYTLDLKFQTKRLMSKLFGYISHTESSLSTSLDLDYKFVNTKEHRVSFKSSIANRSRKNLTIIIGSCDTQATAYPDINFNSNITFQRSGSHMEFKVGLIQNPLSSTDPNSDFESLKFDFLFSHKAFTDSKQTIKAVANVQRKSTNLNLQSMLLYESINADINMACTVSYGNNKQVAVTLFWSHPHTTLEEIKAYINITVPSFTPMILKVDISEKQIKDYQIVVSGTWLSGHSAQAVGSYQDTSTAASSAHHLKVFVKSPSFKDVNAYLLFYRNNEQLIVDMKASYDENDYKLFLSHNSTSEEEMVSSVKIKYKTKLYTLNMSINRGEHLRINTELHIDQLRDVEFAIYVYNGETQKAMSFDINWDANRDPNQKLLAVANFTKAENFNYNADVIVSYPGRTIIGKYQFLLDKGYIDMLASVSWDDAKSLAFKLNIVYQYDDHIFFEIKSQIISPLETMRNMKVNAMFEHVGDTFALNSAIAWSPRQKVALQLYTEYTSNLPQIDYIYSCAIQSTLSQIPNVNTTLKHTQNGTDFISNVHLMYNPEFIIDIDSKWQLLSDDYFHNLTGTVKTSTPFEDYRKAVYVSKIYLTSDKTLKGVAEIDVDHKKILVNIAGKLQRIMDSLFVVNITTPDDKYTLEWKLSKKERHFVALLTYPSADLGTEILFAFNELTNFNVKLLFATPVEFLQHVLVVAKLRTGEVDFRAGWNNLTLGFVGLSHYTNIINFQYQYSILTPLKNFEKSVIVAKLIFIEGLDFDISCEVFLYKLGVKLVGKPKQKPFKDIGVNLGNVYYSEAILRNSDKDDDFLSFEGLIELDIIIYPTMKGQIEIDQKGPVYVLQSKIHLPHGIATIFDEFEFHNILTMANTLRIQTPYPLFKSIRSDFKLLLIESRQYVFNLGLTYVNNTKAITSSVLAQYNVNRRDIDERTQNVSLEVNTPFKAFPKLRLFGAFETEENFYRTKLLFTTNRSDISLDATTEIDDGWVGITSDFYVKTPIVTIPQCQMRVSKMISPSDNYVEVHLDMPERLASEIYSRTGWHITTLNEFKGTLELETPFKNLEHIKADVDFLSNTIKTSLLAHLDINPLHVKVNSSFKNELLLSSTLVQFGEKNIPININCTISAVSLDRRELDGSLLFQDKVFKISGNANLIGSLPAELLITFTPRDNSLPLTFQYNLETTLKGYGLLGTLSYADKLTHFSGNVTANDKLNWEINIQVDPQNPAQKVTMHSVCKSSQGDISMVLQGTTNIPKLENPEFGLRYSDKDLDKHMEGYFVLSQVQGSVDILLTYFYLENMILRGLGKYKNTQYSSSSTVDLFYTNPKKTFELLETGGDIKIDRIWEAGANATLKIPSKSNVTIETHLKVPDEYLETHSLFLDLAYGTGLKFMNYLAKYRASYSGAKYGIWGTNNFEDKKNMTVTSILEWKGDRYDNNASLKLLNKSFDLLYSLKTPKYEDKQFLVTRMEYNNTKNHHFIKFESFYPENVPLANGQIDYVELANMLGMFNVSIREGSDYFTGGHFKTETDSTKNNRYIKLFWPNNTALLNSRCNIKKGKDDGDKYYKGDLLLELPLTTRHIGVVDYEYNKKAKLSTGKATVQYNGENVLEGKYNCLSESQEGREKDTIHVELLNNVWPIGAEYVHKYENDTPGESYKHPILDNRQLHLYHLTNRSKFNVTGEINVETHQDGQLYVLTARHLNRTVTLSLDYAIQAQEYKHHSRLDLSPSVYIEYEFSLINKTTNENFDVEMINLNLLYPLRNFSSQVLYNISDSILTTDVSLMWNEDRSVEVELDWRKVTAHQDQLGLILKHPSFKKDVSIITAYGYENSSINGQVEIEYSANKDQTLILGVRAGDESAMNSFNYTYNIYAEHNATDLYLNWFGHIYYSSTKYGTLHIADYKRSYLSLSRSLARAEYDVELRDIFLKKEDSINGLSQFWARYGGEFPIYTANMTTIDKADYTSGTFYVNFDEKLLVSDFNLTKDSSQSLHMYGTIPNARYATFEIWRDYDDKRVNDVTYYLKLNHSRLIMSKLKWRPDLTSDIQNGIRSKALMMYQDALDQINNTRQYIRAESMDTIDGIWQDAKALVDDFLSDLRNLTVIEEDLEQFKSFLNSSYNNNEFHIKDIITVMMKLFDDLSIKTHLQSLPKIVHELWTVMGASGKNIKESLMLVVEKIKLYYADTTKFIHNLINGDPIKHLSSILEKLVDKYDVFIKNVHVSFLKCVEKLWNETHNMIVENWHQFLAALEPTFLKFIHYGETIIWTTGKEFLDFLYIRKNKIMESAYFMEFTKFSRDFDRFYKDITGNNTVEAIYKYGNIAWNFVNEKYINHIPFGKELKAIVSEIVAELQQLGKVPSIKYALEKCDDMLDTVKYYYKYLKVEYRTQQFIKFVYRKIYEMQVTAIEFENRERTPKTNFIYEPMDGIMILEEKLPMPWHGFNETPEFQEIPEIKAFYDVYKYIESSEASFWNFYYDYKLYTDPAALLPPFKGHALLIGGTQYITFDRKYYDFKGSCTYLLATDFIDRNFTLLVSYNDNGVSDKLVLLINKTAIHIDLFKDTVTFDGTKNLVLPVQIGNSYLYREADIITLTSESEFSLICNVKYQICTFEVSGWHYGRMTGLWGSYDNEPSNDLSLPNGTKLIDMEEFGDYWKVDEGCNTNIKDKPAAINTTPKSIQSLCREFFKSKVSDLSTCYNRVPTTNFLNICMNSSSIQEACRSAIAYIEMCHIENTPLNIPDSCIRCSLSNGTDLKEGGFIRIYGNSIPRTADFVFIVEAKDCNKDLIKHKMFDTLTELLNQELVELNITNNRYAVVTFGGNGIFDTPRTIVSNSKTFSDAATIADYFNIPIGDGSSDIYRALTFTSKLMFRAGASRNFILIPCSQCTEESMQYDYATVHQLLFENSATLHVLTNESFFINSAELRKRESKIPFGIDLNKAYTKKDIKKLEGDSALRASISLSKSPMRQCFSLALETNGSIFSSVHLSGEKNAKKVSTVFAKRLAESAVPRDCTDCECTSLHRGLSYMECTPCTYPRSNMEHPSYYEEDGGDLW